MFTEMKTELESEYYSGAVKYELAACEPACNLVRKYTAYIYGSFRVESRPV
jgi:hypothetical protein